MINILSTWGDRFYVGLTGIEVFTASGEMADIVQVAISTKRILGDMRPTVTIIAVCHRPFTGSKGQMSDGLTSYWHNAFPWSDILSDHFSLWGYTGVPLASFGSAT